MSVSLYCSPTKLRILVGSANARQARIEQFLELPLPENALLNGIITSTETMTRFLTEVNDTYGPFGQDAVVCLESTLVRSRVITIPKTAKQQMIHFVTEELRNAADPGADDIFDYAELGQNREKGGIDVLGIAAGRALLSAYMESFGDAGFKVKNIDVGTNALIKLLAYAPQLSKDNNLLLLIDDSTQFTMLLDHGRFMLMKKFRLIHPDNTDERRREVVNNISTVLQFQQTQNTGKGIQTVHIAGVPHDRVGVLEAFLMNYIHVPFAFFDISDHLKIADKAAFDPKGFDADKYLFNIGSMMGR